MNLRLFALAFLVLLVGTASASVNLTDGLLSYYTFNLTFEDVHGSNNLTNYDLKNTSGVIGNGTGTTTSSDYAQGSRFADIGSEMTLSVWIKPDTSVRTSWLSQRSGSTNDWVFYSDGTDRTKGIMLIWGSPGFSLTTPTGFYTNDVWAHYVITYDGSNLSMYKDGELFDSVLQTSTISNSAASTFRIFNGHDSTWGRGSMDELAVYNRSLNSTEISALYNNGSGLAYPFTTAEDPEPEPSNASLGTLHITPASGKNSGDYYTGSVKIEASLTNFTTPTCERTINGGSSWSSFGLSTNSTHVYQNFLGIGNSNISVRCKEGSGDWLTTNYVRAILALAVRAYDAYDSSILYNLSVNFTNTTGTQSYSTTDSEVLVPVSLYPTIGSFYPSISFNISVSSSDSNGYISRYYEDQDEDDLSSERFIAYLAEAYASFDCEQAYTSNSLVCLQPGPHIRKAGSFTDDVNVTGYYPVSYSYTLEALDNETFNVTGFYDHELTINASDYNGTALTNFTLSVESSLSSFNVSDNNTGTVVLPLLQGYLYNITITQNVPEGEDRNNSIETETFNVTTSSESYQFNLSFPRLFINVYDEQTNLFVTDEPTTITFSKGNSSFSLNTTTGRLNLTGVSAIESGSYSVLFENSAYNPRTYSLTYSRTYPQTLNAYLVPLSAPSTIFTIEDSQSRSPVEGATVTIQRYVNGTLTTVLTRDSDITGRVGFDYIPDRRYEFTIAKTGYATRSFNLDPILFSSYTILLEPSVSFGEIGGDFSGVSIIFSTNRFTESQNNTLTLSFSDSTGGLVSYGYNVSTTTTGQLTSQSGSNAYGSILPSSFAIPDVPLYDQVRVTYYYERSDGIVRTFTTSYSITQVNAYQNQTWVNNRQIAENIAPLDRAAIVVIATGALSALAFTFVGLGGASLSAIVLLGFFAYSGFINGWIVAISIIGFMFLLLGRGSQ